MATPAQAAISALRYLVGRFTTRHLLGPLLDGPFGGSKLPTHAIRARVVGRATHDRELLARWVDEHYAATQRRVAEDFGIARPQTDATVLLVDNPPGLRSVAEHLLLIDPTDPQPLSSTAYFSSDRLILTQLTSERQGFIGHLVFSLAEALLFSAFRSTEKFRWSNHGYASATAWDLAWRRTGRLSEILSHAVSVLHLPDADHLRAVLASSEECEKLDGAAISSVTYCLVQFLRHSRAEYPGGWQLVRESISNNVPDEACISELERALSAPLDAIRLMLQKWCEDRKSEEDRVTK